MLRAHAHKIWETLSRDDVGGDDSAVYRGTFSGGAANFFSHADTNVFGDVETLPRNIAYPCYIYAGAPVA
jgi:hypothetical protein